MYSVAHVTAPLEGGFTASPFRQLLRVTQGMREAFDLNPGPPEHECPTGISMKECSHDYYVIPCSLVPID
jgi:hypothetical protein